MSTGKVIVKLKDMTSDEYIAERKSRAQKLLDIKDLEKRREQAYKLAREFDERLKNHPAIITNNYHRICIECELTEINHD